MSLLSIVTAVRETGLVLSSEDVEKRGDLLFLLFFLFFPSVDVDVLFVVASFSFLFGRGWSEDGAVRFFSVGVERELPLVFFTLSLSMFSVSFAPSRRRTVFLGEPVVCLHVVSEGKRPMIAREDRN